MMKNLLLFALLLSFTAYSQEIIKPDLAPEKMVTDTYHGITLEDPYQYLENLEDQEVIDWMRGNADYAQNMLDNISGREGLMNTIRELYDRKAATIGNTVIAEDGTYYYTKRQQGEEIGKVYQRNGYEGEEKLFFDPNKYNPAEEDLVYTVSTITPNHKGDVIAIGVQPGGTENTDFIFFRKDGSQLEDKLELVEYGTWTKADDGILYTQSNSADVKDPNRYIATKVRLHKMGTDTSQDTEFFSNALYPQLNILDLEFPLTFYIKNPDRIFSMAVTVDKSVRLFISDNSFANTDKTWQEIAKLENNVQTFSVNKEHIYYLTFKDAPNYKITRASINAASFENSQVIVPEFEDEIINDIELSKDGLFFNTTKNGVEAQVYFLAHDAKEPKKLSLPFAAGFASIDARGANFSDVWVSIEGWTSPEKRFRYDVSTDTFKHEPLSTPVEYPELANLVAKEVMVESHDGVMVPVSIVHDKNLKLDGNNPAMILGYGSYGISMEPFFSPISLGYTTQGGVLVVPHVRGGGELGDAWHKAGQKLKKPNTWKDAIATAEYLVENGYTAKDKLSIMGGSAGGIFVGRSITERPDLFAAAAPLVGALNMVRIEESPGGPVNTPEFGTIKDSLEFKGLLAMDSYHSLKKGTDYPAMLITSGFNDPRVTAWEPAKFAAKMQRYHSGDDPILFLTSFDEGHGGRTTLSNRVKLFANVFSFFYWQSGHPDFQPKEKIKG